MAKSMTALPLKEKVISHPNAQTIPITTIMVIIIPFSHICTRSFDDPKIVGKMSLYNVFNNPLSPILSMAVADRLYHHRSCQTELLMSVSRHDGSQCQT